MSRTYKDKSHKYNKEELSWNDRYELVEYEGYVYDYHIPYEYPNTSYREHIASRYIAGTRIKTFRIEKAGILKKRKRSYVNRYDYWYRSTPGWWIREFMTAPKRAACRNWEKSIKHAQDFEEVEDCPDFGRKPHKYYW